MESKRRCLVSGGRADCCNVLDEIYNSVRIAVLVVVPGDELVEIVIERNACLDIKDGAVRGAHKVLGNDVVLSPPENSLHLSVAGLLDGHYNVICKSRLQSQWRLLDGRQARATQGV